VHEELIKQKTAFQSRLQDRDGEISRLRNQVSVQLVLICGYIMYSKSLMWVIAKS